MNKNVIDMHNTVSTEEITEIIETSAKDRIENRNSVWNTPALMLRGAPGVGKSTIVKTIANKLGIGFIDVRLAQMERVDFCGLPSVTNGATQWNVPAFWPRDKKSKGIILLDEITSAPADCQVAAYSLVLDRAIPNSDYKLPEGWLIVAAGNRTCDRAVVKSMSSALANRFAHFNVEANSEDWVKWATQNSINPTVIGFINYRPALLFKMDDQNLEQGWPSPRSWERVSSSIQSYGHNPSLLRKMVYGLVGNSVGCEFMEFFKLQSEIENVLDIMLNPKKDFTVPTTADKKYAVVSAVAYHLWNGKDKEDTEKRVNGFYKIMMKLPNDFATLLIKCASLGNKNVSQQEAISALIQNKNFKEAREKFRVSFDQQFNSL